MKAVEFIVEYSKKQVRSLENNLEQRLSKFPDPSLPPSLVKKGKTSTNLADQLIQYLGTELDGYLFWILHRYVTNGISRWEDITTRAIPGIKRFKELRKKNKIPKEQTDINKFKTLDQLDDMLDKFREDDEPTSKKAIENRFYETGQAKLIHNDENIKVVVPNTTAASCFFGKNTRWCTAASNPDQWGNIYNAFNSYNERGPLYIILIKKLNQRYQLQYSSSDRVELMDELDHPVKPRDLAKKYPMLNDIFTPIANKHRSLVFNNNSVTRT